MSPAYLDTSALLKRYVAEVGSSWANALLADAVIPLFCISQLAVVEATCAFARRLRRDAVATLACPGAPGFRLRLPVPLYPPGRRARDDRDGLHTGEQAPSTRL